MIMTRENRGAGRQDGLLTTVFTESPTWAGQGLKSRVHWRQADE